MAGSSALTLEGAFMTEEARRDPEPVDLTPHRMAPRADGREIDGAGDGLVTLTGFVGESTKEGYVRVYLDLSFTSYCEVATADVVKTKRVDAADEDSPTVLWVTASAQMGLVSVGRLSGSASFVSGAIRSRYGRGPKPVAASLPDTDYPCTVFFICKQPPEPSDWCGSDWCLSEGVPCPTTREIFCP